VGQRRREARLAAIGLERTTPLSTTADERN
jgi:hypothetical protein